MIRHNNRRCFDIQLQQDLYCPPVPSLCVCLCVSVTEGVAATNTHTDMQQLANKDEFCCAWQRFSVHYFPLYPACIPDLSSCLSCKDTLSGPDSSFHAHTACMAHTHSGCVQAPLPLTVLHMQGAYVAIYLTSTPSCTALSTLCLSPPLLFSHFSSGGKSVFLFFGLFPQSWLSSATCLLSHSTFTGAAFIPAQGALSGFSVRSTHVCVS